MPAIRLPAWLRRGLEAGLFAGLLSLLTVVTYRWDRGAAIPAIRDDGEQREQPGEQPRLEAAAEPRGKANGRHRRDPRGVCDVARLVRPVLAEDRDRVLATEPEPVDHDRVELRGAGDPRDVVEVAVGQVGVLAVGRRRD